MLENRFVHRPVIFFVTYSKILVWHLDVTMRSLTWVRNVNLSGSCNKTHTLKAEREIKGETGVNSS